ncbi:MAG: RNA-binding protein [Magnetococcales bacterium]|nr:RNA-binding protein [Magnetococcales bacterium]
MNERCRLDKWLWAARFFKTRTLATEAINGGKVHLNGDRCKPGRALSVGEVLEIRKGPFVYIITIQALSDRRGPYKEAILLYEESQESIGRRERVQEGLKAQIRPVPGGRPTKKDRRNYTKAWPSE